ncbi:MAG: thiamine pyrophosphate-binding protein [Gammaproteobacteria bacterium]|nr:thiamine pyrophosphate-binding protein [Gammaproteobacteria bacterium]MYG65625.1 thiamine pyrophosphate-binding protein [Gammaproteobacteria bacterium]
MNTVGHLIGRTLKAYGVPYITGLPGHGNWNLLDAFNDPGSDIPVVQTMHEQAAVHVADAHYRATGQPIAACTSIGPGAANTIMGLANAHCDSTALLLITGAASTHMRGHGVMQEMDRENVPDFTKVTAQVTKRNFDMITADSAAFILHRAFNAMLTGRPGPVHVDIPLDVQSAQTEVQVQELANRLPTGRPRADSHAVDAAIRLLLNAERPCIVAGGGAISSNASPALKRLVERLGIPVVFTWNGKGALPEDHPMNAGTVGWPGSLTGNTLASEADVVMSLGCRFNDWSSSSWRKGVSFSIPDSRLIHIDIDPREIGKNYPVEVGSVSDISLALEDIDAGISDGQAGKAYKRRSAHHDRLTRLWREWDEIMEPRRSHSRIPTTMLRTLRELRKVLPRNGIVTVGSGHPQSSTKQDFPIYEPRTHITPGSYSPMGFALPAAIGAKLARPDAPVVCIIGDGDFMMCMQELATCVAYDIPVVFLILNNSGYISIRDGQDALMGRNIISEFSKNGNRSEPYSVDFPALAKSFGFDFANRITEVDRIGPTIRAALESGGPALVEVPITRDVSIAASNVVGWWDFPPVPTAPRGVLEDYAAGISAEQHRGRDTSNVRMAKAEGAVA